VNENQLDAIFAAVSDPTRRAILVRLSSGEASVMELVEPFAMSQPAISRHLKVLEKAGLIVRGREAQRRPCRLVKEPLAEAGRWLDAMGGEPKVPAKKKKKKKHGGKRKKS
jgi:DNA-binding transcriptional ArsR family regulator